MFSVRSFGSHGKSCLQAIYYVHLGMRNMHQNSSLFSHGNMRQIMALKIFTQGNYCQKCTNVEHEADGSPKPDGDTHHSDGKHNTARELLNDCVPDHQQKEEPEFPSDENYMSKYKTYDDWNRSQEKHSYRPDIDPRETSIILFPGQGSQHVGMGKNLVAIPKVKHLFDTASSMLGYDLLNMCLNGPEAALEKTVHCQPAVFVMSLAAVELLKETNPKAIENCVATAGFSVGEYAALVFAGVISFKDALEVIQVRATSMQEASEAVPSGMMTVRLRHDSKLKFAMLAARRYCTERRDIEDPVCEVANYLYPECKVVAGNIESLDFIKENRREFGISACKQLAVSGAFHTKLMLPARESVKKVLQNIVFQPPIIPVYSNVTSHKYKNLSLLPNQLAQQVYKPVKWEQTMHVLYERGTSMNFPHSYEVGPGNDLGAILKKTNFKAFSHYHDIPV